MASPVMDTVKSRALDTLRDLAAHAHSSSSIAWQRNNGLSQTLGQTLGQTLDPVKGLSPL